MRLPFLRLNDVAFEAMRDLACGGLDDVPSAEQMEILPNIILHWPQEAVFPAIGKAITNCREDRTLLICMILMEFDWKVDCCW